jgi:hypothetical protein
MNRERRERAEREEILATRDPASLVTCPTCREASIYCGLASDAAWGGTAAALKSGHGRLELSTPSP